MTDTSGEQSGRRVFDAQRNAAIATLGRHFQAGRLDMEELGRRLDAAEAATTRADLARLLDDLPGPEPEEEHPAEARARPTVSAVALLVLTALVALTVTIVSGAAGGLHWHGHPPSWWLMVIPLLLLRRVIWRGPPRGSR